MIFVKISPEEIAPPAAFTVTVTVLTPFLISGQTAAEALPAACSSKSVLPLTVMLTDAEAAFFK